MTFEIDFLRPGDVEATRELILRVLEDDLKYGYRPDWHWDIDDLLGTYSRTPEQTMLVARASGASEDRDGSAILGTIAVRPGGPNSPPHPSWLAERYSGPAVAQLYRAYIAPHARRQGVASALVAAMRDHLSSLPAYEVIYLHTDPTNFPSALDFWRAMPSREIYDGRGDEATKAVHFELAFSDGTFERRSPNRGQ